MTTLASFSDLQKYVLLCNSGSLTFSGSNNNVYKGSDTLSYSYNGQSTFGSPAIGSTVAQNSTDSTNAAINLGNLNTNIRAMSKTSIANELNGQTLISGVYTSNLFSLNGTLTLNGDANSLFYFISDTNITLSSGSFINLIGGINSTNIYWVASTGINILMNTIGGIFISSNNILTNNNVAITGNLYSISGNITLNDNVINGANIVCFLAGTKISTTNGDISVENLKVGDNVLTHGSIANGYDVKLNFPVFKPITWIGSFKPLEKNKDSFPICFKKGSLGDNIPYNDLFVSPGHRIILEGKMVNANTLINGDSIYQNTNITDIEYYHIEFETHNVIVSEGLLVESYLDVGNRRTFTHKSF